MLALYVPYRVHTGGVGDPCQHGTQDRRILMEPITDILHPTVSLVLGYPNPPLYVPYNTRDTETPTRYVIEVIDVPHT